MPGKKKNVEGKKIIATKTRDGRNEKVDRKQEPRQKTKRPTKRIRIGEADNPGPQVYHKLMFMHEGAQLQRVNMPDDG